MRSFKNWKLKESVQNAEWEQMKSMRLQASPEAKAFVHSRVGKIQEAIVHKLHESDPKVNSYRDVPAEIRDQFAQAIVASTLEWFFGNMSADTQSRGATPPAPQQTSPQQPPMLPQDEPQTPAVSGR